MQIAFAVRLVSRIANQKSDSTKGQKINLQDLIQRFQTHFIQKAALYESPLNGSKGLLSYTARFSQTVINLEKVTLDQKKAYFKKIKRSIMTNSFTPKSSVQLCEAMINLPFEGDEEPVLQKLRDYMEHHSVELSSKQTDRFNLAYKYLMIEKARGPVKFVDCLLKSPGAEDAEFSKRIKHLFETYKINQYSLNDWMAKRQIQLEMKVGEKKMNIRIKGLNKDCKSTDLEIFARKMLISAEKGHLVLLPNLRRKQSTISRRKLAKQLLIPKKLYRPVQQMNVEQYHQTNKSVLLHLISSSGSAACQNVYGIDIPEIQRVNHILSQCSESDLKRAFGYLQLNLFHIQYKQLLHILNSNKRALISRLPSLDLSKQIQTLQLQEFKILLLEELQARAIVSFLREKNVKSIHIILEDKQICQSLERILRLAYRKFSEQAAQEQNKSLGVLKNKLALISVMYQLPMELPVIDNAVRSLQNVMHPFTASYRQ